MSEVVTQGKSFSKCSGGSGMCSVIDKRHVWVTKMGAMTTYPEHEIMGGMSNSSASTLEEEERSIPTQLK